MTEQKQPEALRLAEQLNCNFEYFLAHVAAELRRQHAEIEAPQDDLAHKDDYAEQLGHELAKADSEAKELRAKLDELARQRPCGYLPYGYVGRSAMVYGQPVPESVPIYLAAGARPVGEVPAGEYPPLPEVYATMHDDGHWTMKAGKEPYESYYAGWRKTVYTADQMWRYVDADRAMRATQPAPAAQDDAKDAARWRYAVAIGENQAMNWLDVYNDWDGEGSFVDAIDAALEASKKEPTNGN